MQARIIRFAMVVSLVAITVFGLPLAAGAARYYVVDEQSDLEGDTQAAADGIAPVLAAGDIPGGVSPVSADSPAAVYGLDGRRITGDGPPRLAPALGGALRGRVVRATDAGEFVVAVPVFDGDRRVGVLRASRQESDAVKRVGVTWAVMLVLGIAAVVGSRLVARRLAVRLSAPLEVLAKDAARLGEGDFTVSEPAPDGRRAPVPEIAAVHRSLAVTATRLDALLTRERAFSAEASHQLRTPLAGLRLRLEEAASLPPGSPPAAEALDGALEAADRLDRTVGELLRLAREPAGARREVLTVDELVDGVVAEARADGVPEGRSIAARAEDGDLHARASAAAVRQNPRGARRERAGPRHGPGDRHRPRRGPGRRRRRRRRGHPRARRGGAVHGPHRGPRGARHRARAGPPARRGPGRAAAAALRDADDRDAAAARGRGRRRDRGRPVRRRAVPSEGAPRSDGRAGGVRRHERRRAWDGPRRGRRGPWTSD